MEQTEVRVGFRLIRITTEQFAFIEEAYNEGVKIGLSTNLNFRLDFEKKIIGVASTVKFLQNSVPFLIIEIRCFFLIHQDSWDAFPRNGEDIIIPKTFVSHLAVLTIGTCRGVLHAKTENTPYNKFLLPTINVNDLIKADLVFQLPSLEGEG